MEETRQKDLDFLNRYYESGISNVLVVYGHRNIEDRELVEKFIENRRNVYYLARSASDKEQRFLWGNDIRKKGIDIAEYPTYTEIFDACISTVGRNPIIIVVRNFEHIVKMSDSFMAEVSEFLTVKGKERQILFILESHDINWVENTMVATLGKNAGVIAGCRKLKPLSFSEIRAYFPTMSYKDAVMAYSVLGGRTRLWKYFDEKLSFKENICKNLLNDNSFLYGEAIRLTEQNLRETAVYHTLLAEMARGVNKLNDLYHVTGFSRAKISVYLKTLIHHDFVYKADSFGSAGRENVMKGVYKICDPMVLFFFKFVYPNQTDLMLMPNEKFYDIFISAGMQDYLHVPFKAICREYIFKLEERGQFPFEISEDGEWNGKEGDIDIIVQSDTGDTALGMCFWGRQATHADYVKLHSDARKARLEGDVIYLFSTGGFDAWLTDAAMKSSESLKLIGIDELTNG
ncbi:ATP-binding protein [Butyrivibrio sp. VCB2006]|uniref:ATP-binding protein n=1 Tax=Butyrivibrio sp. VCB2006 TaxID=1280679 RepID=UPI0003FF6855|nr:DUF234 domain-containing protein [Butyrivibrio sp. VCB2006]